MKITFIGTGDASDKYRRNTSILVSEPNGHHLLDCGFSSAHGFLGVEDKKPLKTIWISHFHGDHFFGVPQLIVHYYMQNRKELLTICSGLDCREKIISAINLAYPGLSDKLPFPIKFLQIAPGETINHCGLSWCSAPVNHSQCSFSLKISNDRASLYYSGDGKPTSEAMELIQGCDVVIHEAYSINPTKLKHFSLEECLLLAQNLNIPQLALIHIDKHSREEFRERCKNLQSFKNTRLLLPDDNDTLIL